MYVSRGGHGIHDVPSSSVSFLGGGDFKTREKEKKRKKKELPLESSPHVRERTEKSTRLVVVRKRKRKRGRGEEERAPRFNNGAAFRARGERLIFRERERA